LHMQIFCALRLCLGRCLRLFFRNLWNFRISENRQPEGLPQAIPLAIKKFA
ncbi:hypothetical protein T4C_9060, partial [Trichinella pseudospiralis]